MKSANKGLGLISRGMLFAGVPFGLFFIGISCQRTIDHVAVTNEFNSAAAKEWYYGTFKKTTEWASSPEHGKKLPDWKNGVYRKIGTMEIVEFPLVKAKTSFAISSVGALTTADRKRVAEASLTRIVFIKNANQKIVVREIDYIPDWDYLQKRNFDISSDIIGKANNGFSGRLMVKKWNNTMLTTWIVKNGEFKKKTRPVLASSPAGRTLECGTLVFWFDRACGLVLVGDALQVVCDEWEYTGNSEFIPHPCEETSPCEGLTPEQCACEMYQTCNDDGDDEEEENCDQNFQNLISSSNSVNEKVAIQVTHETPTTRTVALKWKIHVVSSGLTSVKVYSHEIGVHYKPDPTYSPNVWYYLSLNHSSLSKTGTSILWTLTPTTNSHYSTKTNYSARMFLNYNITIEYVCKGSPLVSSDDYDQSESWSSYEIQ